LNREQNTQPEQTKSPEFQRFEHLESGLLVIQRATTTTSSSTNIPVSLITLTVSSFVNFLFHLSSPLTL
uniref:Ovule protein n=1 Tax=Rodentolepis nana TaxID=102285 RepID=A0A0R3T020_RODNA